jgi:uncharacterized protein YcnI
MENAIVPPANSRLSRTRQGSWRLAAATLLAAGVMWGASDSALAHVTLEVRSAPVGSYQKLVFRVPHGCNGADTTRVRVRLPDGVVAVKPQPKPGWALRTQEGDYANPVQLHGSALKRGVREVDWTGQLPDAWYDEFAVMAYLSDALQPGQVLHFPVVQECGDRTARWIDASGDAGTENPAPALTLTPTGSR